MSDIFEKDIDDESLDIAALEDDEGSDSSYSKNYVFPTTSISSSWCIQARAFTQPCRMT